MREMTAEELAAFNGKTGNPVYVAFQGKIYDVSKSPLWSTGAHMKRHASGKELSGEISAAPHGPEVFERFTQIAILKKGPPEELKHLPPMLQSLLQRFPMARRHPHPMLVHFPIAFFMGASLFALLRLYCPSRSVELTSAYLLLLGGISAPFAIMTGLLTWWINYRMKLNPFVKKKIQLSILLLAFLIVLLAWRTSNPNAIASPVYFAMVLLLTPIVGLLGYYGGQLTFPVEEQRE